MEIIVKHRHTRDLLEDPLVLGLLERVSDGALIIDAKDRTILAMNGRARDLLGYRREQVIGCQCSSMMNSPACSRACPLTALMQGRTKDGALDLYYRGKDGSRMLQAHTRMLLIVDPEGTPLVGVELFSDLREVKRLKRALRSRTSLHGIIGGSQAMSNLYELVEQIAPYDLPVLITGPSGVGKERFADAVQYHSFRADKLFLKINCAALSPGLVESELFGHRRGAFTGAVRDRGGFFEEADGGTLMLDEIGDLPLQVQAKLLRVLQEGEIQRLGEDRIRCVDVRIIAATNKVLEAEVKRGAFRGDLFYRLAGVRLDIPPLEQRREDIPLLADHFVKILAETLGRQNPLPTQGLSRAARAVLVDRPWPGNVRELENVLRLALIRAPSGGKIEPEHIAPPLFEAGEGFVPKTLAEIEARAIEAAMRESGGNLSKTSRVLGIDRSTLWRKLRKEQREG